jgi:hypothetical protein
MNSGPPDLLAHGRKQGREVVATGSRKSRTGGKGGEVWHQGGRSHNGVGEVGASLMRLFVAVRIERGGATVRGRRGGRGRSWKGRRGALARGGAWGGDGRAEGGRRRRHSVERGTVIGVGMARGEAEAGRERKRRMKRESSSTGAPLIAAWGGGWGGGNGGQRIRWAARFGPAGWRVGPGGFDISPNYLNRFKLGNWERMPYLPPNIPNVCMLLDLGIMNNSLNCADIQFSIELELKILEQIHHLNFWWIFKEV